MTDPAELTDALDAAEDAFAHTHGTPEYEPAIARSDANPGEVRLQKACRLLLAANLLRDEGHYYTSVLEHAFAAIERSLEGYLLAYTGAHPNDFYDHETVYRHARRQAPLEDATVDSIQRLYAARRTEHYYGTTVTTSQQAREMLRASEAVHSHLRSFGPELSRYCRCEED